MGQEDTATDAPVGTTQAPAPAGASDVLRLCGRHTNGVDAKARVVMPASFRPAFAGGGLLTVWQDRCLAAFPLVEFDRYVAHMRRALATAGEAEPDAVLRELYATTSEMRLDVQGRLVLPEELRALVGIDGEVRFQGFGRRVELWPAVALDPDDAADHRATIGLLQSTFDLADHIEG